MIFGTRRPSKTAHRVLEILPERGAQRGCRDVRDPARLLRGERERRRERPGQRSQQEAPTVHLLYHPIRSQQQRRWDRAAERLGGLQVDDKIELRRLFDRQVGWLGALEDLVDEKRCSTILFVHTPAEGGQHAVFGVWSPLLPAGA